MRRTMRLSLNWMLLAKKGNSNLREQKKLLKSTLRLLKGYQVIVIGDREFGNLNLADWLSKQGCYYVLRTKSNKYIQQNGKNYQKLSSLGLKPGKSWYLKQVKFTKQLSWTRVNLAFYWSRATKGKKQNEGWYLINNLSSWKQTISAYKKRMGIEAMFRDCKSGGYNLEKCKGNNQRLLSLILLIAIAYTCTIQKGKNIAFKRVKEYVCRLSENQRTNKRHSSFWVGLYGSLWVENFQICQDWVERLMILTPNKLPFYLQGIRAKTLIISTL